MSFFNYMDKPKPPPEGYYDNFKESNYECPKCGIEPPDEPYWNEQDWPESYNSGSSCTDMGHFYYWQEFHKCPKCNTKFWFESGN